MVKLTLERKIFLVISGCLIFSLVIVGTVIWPTIHSIQGLRQEIYDLRLYLEKRYQRTVGLRSSLQKIEKIKLETAAYPDYVFAAGDELRLITLLEGFAAKNNVAQKITSSNLDKITNSHILVSLSISGDYHNVLTYLADIENSHYFMTVRQVQLTTTSDQASHAQTVLMNLDLSLYAVN